MIVWTPRVMRVLNTKYDTSNYYLNDSFLLILLELQDKKGENRT